MARRRDEAGDVAGAIGCLVVIGFVAFVLFINWVGVWDRGESVLGYWGTLCAAAVFYLLFLLNFFRARWKRQVIERAEAEAEANRRRDESERREARQRLAAKAKAQREQEAAAAAGKTATSTRRQIPERVRREVWRRDEGRCVECGSKENLEFHHIIPVSRGGADTARNLELLCQSCHAPKGNRI